MSVDAYIPVEFCTSLDNSQISTETEVAMGSLSNYDIFHTRYYSGVTYAGDFEMPVINGTDQIPERIVRFSDSKSRKRNDPSAWVVPYEYDVKLRPFWNNPFKYMDRLLEHPGIVSWDFSMYRNMPFALQYWNCFRGRLLGSLYERCGGVCIPNIRPTDRRSYIYAFDGIPTEATIAMGTAGALNTADDRAIFKAYVDESVSRLRPKNIIVYGIAPADIFDSALDAGVNVKSYPTQTALAHQTEAA